MRLDPACWSCWLLQTEKNPSFKFNGIPAAPPVFFAHAPPFRRAPECVPPLNWGELCVGAFRLRVGAQSGLVIPVHRGTEVFNPTQQDASGPSALVSKAVASAVIAAVSPLGCPLTPSRATRVRFHSTCSFQSRITMPNRSSVVSWRLPDYL